MTIDRTQFDNSEASIQKTRSKQSKELNQQVREHLDTYRKRYGRVNFLQKRIAEIEENLEIRGQQIESLHTTFNTAMFRDDEKSMQEAKASRVEVAAEIEELENELVSLKQEYEDNDFDPVSEGEELLQDVREAKALISGDTRTNCLDQDLERAFHQIDATTREVKLERVRSKRTAIPN